MSHPVAIVGAGPVGMTAALELARLGVEAVLLDEKESLVPQGSRSIVLARHTLETFERLGCGEAMLERAVVLVRARTYIRDVEIRCVDLTAPAAGKLPAFVNLQQTYTEEALLRRVEESPLVEVRWRTRVRSLQDDNGGAAVGIETDGRSEKLAASYVIGCDGAHSTVRKLLGVEFPGKSFADRFLITDIRANLPFPNERRFFFDPPLNRGRQVLIHPQPDGEWRVDWQVPGEIDVEAERRSGRIDERIRTLVGSEPYELVWLTAYRFHERLASRFRVGRTFLAGDAAHLMSVFGARGLNSGVEDVRNLAWKLELVLTGQAPERLLDTYERERRAAARENLRITGATMRFMAPPTRLHRAYRNAILRGSLRVPALRRFVNSGKLATPAVYGASDDPLVGRLAPGVAGRLRHALGSGFTLLAFSADGELEHSLARWVAAARAVAPLELVTVALGASAAPAAGTARLADEGGELARAYGVDGADALFLIRPDGYVAARLEPAGEPELVAALRAELGLR